MMLITAIKQHIEAITYVAVGGVAPHIGAAMGVVETKGILEAIVASAIGAATAWTVHQILNSIKNRFKKK